MALALVVWLHLRVATPVSGRTLGIGMLALWLAAAGTRLGLQWQSHKRLGDELYLSKLMPPGWRVAPAQPVESFVGAAATDLKTRLDARLKDKDETPDDVIDGVDGLD